MCITKRDREIWTEIVSRIFWCMGLRPEDKVVFGFAIGLFVGGLPLIDAIQNIGAALIPLGLGDSKRLVEFAKRLKANVLPCTPSYALYLAEFIRKEFNEDPEEIGIRKIISGAEPGIGIPAIRKKIEKEWGAVAVEGLGNSDAAPIIWGECPWQQGMHFCAQEFIIPELIDPDSGEVIEWGEGERGELVYTHIDREASPVIRFRTGDHVECWVEECECGRTSIRVRCFGRTDDMIKVKGVKIWPSAIRDVVASFAPKTTGNIQILIPKDATTFAVKKLVVEVEYGEIKPEELPTLKDEIEVACKERLFVKPEIILVPPNTLPRFEHKAKLIKLVDEL